MQNHILKSFARRIGKSLSKSQKHMLQNELDKFLYSKEKLLHEMPKYKSIAIEVGIGMAEHFVNQARLSPDILFIGIEPYLNGIANCLKLAGESQVKNFLLWPDDADMILPDFEENSIEKFYLLFPDPWPKTKQKKRRFASKHRIKLIENIITPSGYFIFASDMIDYANEVEEEALNMGFKKLSILPHEAYIKTKFHAKAIEAGRVVTFLTLQK